MLSTGISSCLPFNPVSLCIVCRCNYVSTMEDKSLRTSAVHVHVVHPVVTHCNFLQIWTFLRTDTTHNKQQVLAIRPEGVPSLRPASVHYIQKAVRDANIGVKSDRKDFLEGIPEPGEVISKVSRATGAKQKRCILVYLQNFSTSVKADLVRGTCIQTHYYFYYSWTHLS